MDRKNDNPNKCPECGKVRSRAVSVDDPRSKAWKTDKRPAQYPTRPHIVRAPSEAEEQARRAGRSGLFDDHPSLTPGERNS